MADDGADAAGRPGATDPGAPTSTGPAARWAALGVHRRLAGHRIFTVDVPADGPEVAEPLLVLHGFPTSSFDFHAVLPALRRGRRVLLFDMLGYGLSDKPDQPYRVAEQADIAGALVAGLGVTRLALLTHDVGDTVGGELLARQLEGRWPVTVTRRVLTNGSIYMALVRLSAGQEFLLSLPDARLPADAAPGPDALAASLAGTFGAAPVADDELAAMVSMVTAGDGQRLLPRLVRYVEERRSGEARFTGAVERHPSPLSVLWGTDDPIAVPAMAARLQRARPDARVTLLDGVGHYPMIEAPEHFARAVASSLA